MGAGASTRRRSSAAAAAAASDGDGEDGAQERHGPAADAAGEDDEDELEECEADFWLPAHAGIYGSWTLRAAPDFGAEATGAVFEGSPFRARPAPGPRPLRLAPARGEDEPVEDDRRHAPHRPLQAHALEALLEAREPTRNPNRISGYGSTRVFRNECSGTFSWVVGGNYGEAFKPDGPKKPRETSSM